MKIRIILLILLAPVLSGCSIKYDCNNVEANSFVDKFIAHGGGSYNNIAVTNSLEALNYNYSVNSYKYFEVDFLRTSDGKIVLMHDWRSGLPTFFSQDHIPNIEEYKKWKMNFGLTQMSMEDLFVWLKDKPDIYIITDTKENNNISILQDISTNHKEYVKQIIPQIYKPDEYDRVIELGYKNVILTLYKYPLSDEEILKFLENKKNIMITMPIDMANKKLPRKINELGIPVFTHTVNKIKEVNNFQNNCVNGFYTDNLKPEK